MTRESYDITRDIWNIQKLINEITVTNAYSGNDKLDRALMMEVRAMLEKHRDELIEYRNELRGRTQK